MSTRGPASDPVAQLRQLQRRVGLTGPERLSWGVTFAQRDLDQLTPGEWTDLMSELRVFLAAPFPWEPQSLDEALRRLRSRRPSLPRLDVELRGRRLTETDVRDIQRAFRSVFDELVGWKKSTAIEGLPVTFDLYLAEHPDRPQETVIILQARTDSLRSKALCCLAYLLVAHGGLLRRCPDPKCQRLFVASRTNQVYCSTRCLSRAATRAYRQRGKAQARAKKRKGGR